MLKALRHSLLGSCLSDRRGGVVLLFSIAVPVILTAVGIAVDYAKMTDTRNKLQVLADSAVLAAIAGTDTSTSRKRVEATAREAAELFFLNSRADKGLPNATMTSFAMSPEGEVEIDVEADIDLTFGKFFGKETATIDSTASAIRAVSMETEVVLVLDNTGSMAGRPLEDLKDATLRFVEILEDFGDDNVWVGIVPFARYVNVGVDERNNPAFDVPADSSERVYSCRTEYTPIDGQICTTEEIETTCTNDGVSSPCTRSQTSCTYPGGVEENEVCEWRDRNSAFRGCMGSRPSPDDTIADWAPGDRRIPGMLNQSCGQPITRLTSNYGLLETSLNSMSARDNTFISTGVLWGWRLLSDGAPFQDAKPASDDIQKVMILMTDGSNTASPNYPAHSGSDVNESNDLMFTVCENARRDDIRIMAVKVGDSDSDGFLDCAADPQDAVLVRDSRKLVDVFEDFASAIFGPRLTN